MRPARTASRVAGVDVARGAALVGMLAVHVFPMFDGDGSASLATQLAAGRSSAVFATMAGVGLALITGGSRPLNGPALRTRTVGLVVRALLIGLLGLLLGYVTVSSGIEVYVILAYYAVMFLIAIPLLRLPPVGLFVLAGLVALSGTLLLDVFVGEGPDVMAGADPTLGDALRHPIGLPLQLLVGGSYPAAVWVCFVLAGIGLGRLDLTSRRVATWCVAAGVALAGAAWAVSQVLLYPLGGLRRIRRGASDREWSDERLLWAPFPGEFDTWWWYAGRAPHSDAPLALLGALGSAVAVLGLALLATRVALLAQGLAPVAAAGSMILTLYIGHILVLATGIFDGRPGVPFAVLLAVMLVFATWWRRGHRRGPLEALIALVVGRVRRAAVSRIGAAPVRRR